MTDATHSMRIMHIISGDLWAGAEVQAYTLLSCLRHQCDLSVVLLNPGRLADELARLNIPVTILDETHLGSVSILLRLRRLMKQFRPQVIHTHRQKENILASFANLSSGRAKCVRTSHGAHEFAPKGRQRFQMALDNFVGRHLQHAIIAVSDELKIKLEKVFPAKKIHVIRNGIDVESLRAAATEADFRRAMPDHTHIGIIGRLEPVKRVDIFLEMIPHLRDRLPERELYFHVIGDGKQRTQLERQAQDLEVADLVQFHGHRSDMPACIHSLDAIVMCSDHEGTPMTALEALALGTPLIAHKVGGLKDIMSSDPTSLVECHSSIGYADSLKNVLTTHKKAVSLKDKYLASDNAARTAALYRSIA